MIKRQYDLEDRLIRFAANIIFYTKSLPQEYASEHLSKQLIRSATSPALNYGEAQGAESNKDFIHKNGIVLKELKESRVTLKILSLLAYGKENQRIQLLKECEELIAIVATIIKKSKKNL